MRLSSPDASSASLSPSRFHPSFNARSPSTASVASNASFYIIFNAFSITSGKRATRPWHSRVYRKYGPQRIVASALGPAAYFPPLCVCVAYSCLCATSSASSVDHPALGVSAVFFVDLNAISSDHQRVPKHAARPSLQRFQSCTLHLRGLPSFSLAQRSLRRDTVLEAVPSQCDNVELE